MTAKPPHPDTLDRLLAAAQRPGGNDVRLTTACVEVTRALLGAGASSRLPSARRLLVVATSTAAVLAGAATAVVLSRAPRGHDGPPVAQPVPAVVETTASPSPAPLADRSHYTVTALNGSGHNGVASGLTPVVAGYGYRTTRPANALRQNYPDSFVAYAPGRFDVADNLAHDLGITRLRPMDSTTPNHAGADAIVVVGNDALAQRFMTAKPADRRTFDACSKDYEQRILTLHPTDRTLPATLTWNRLAHVIARYDARGCTSAKRLRVADDTRRSFEFLANAAWAVAYVRAYDRHDRKAIQRATMGLADGVARPAVLRGYGDSPDVIDRRLARAARRGEIAPIRSHVVKVLKPAQNPWMAEIR